MSRLEANPREDTVDEGFSPTLLAKIMYGVVRVHDVSLPQLERHINSVDRRPGTTVFNWYYEYPVREENGHRGVAARLFSVSSTVRFGIVAKHRRKYLYMCDVRAVDVAWRNEKRHTAKDSTQHTP